MNADQVFGLLKSEKIQSLQLDPFGFCNNGCWFCPRGYVPNPRIYRQHMPVDLLDHVLGQFFAAKGGVVSPFFWHVFSCHYNEVLLYKFFPEFIGLLGKYGFCTTILSNGTTLTSENIGVICDAVRDNVVCGVCFNIPSIVPDDFARFTGRDVGVCGLVRDMVGELVGRLGGLVDVSRFVSIVVNGQDDEFRGLLGRGAPVLPLGDVDFQLGAMRGAFPGVNVYKSGWLYDRAGLLSKLGVFDHSSLFVKFGDVVCGCSNGFDDLGRPFGWAHVNSLGELFLCCCDYYCDYTFGSLVSSSLEEVWLGRDHVKMVMRAFDGICRTCCSAVKA